MSFDPFSSLFLSEYLNDDENESKAFSRQFDDMPPQRSRTLQKENNEKKKYSFSGGLVHFITKRRNLHILIDLIKRVETKNFSSHFSSFIWFFFCNYYFAFRSFCQKTRIISFQTKLTFWKWFCFALVFSLGRTTADAKKKDLHRTFERIELISLSLKLI